MKSSSNEIYDFSDSDIDDYEDKSYVQFKSGKIKVKMSNGSYKCQFCLGKKKIYYQYRELLQHASGIGVSYNRKMIVRANHLALEKYLKNDLAITSSSSPQLPIDKQEPS